MDTEILFILILLLLTLKVTILKLSTITIWFLQNSRGGLEVLDKRFLIVGKRNQMAI